jgi:hypothetical protein
MVSLDGEGSQAGDDVRFQGEQEQQQGQRVPGLRELSHDAVHQVRRGGEKNGDAHVSGDRQLDAGPDDLFFRHDVILLCLGGGGDRAQP